MHQRTVDQLKHMYIITGTKQDGKRFHPIRTRTPENYNIYNGTIWELLPNGKRKLIKRINN